MLTAEQLGTWREAVNGWRVTADPQELADAMAELSPDDRAAVLELIEPDALRAEVARLLLDVARAPAAGKEVED